MWPFLCFICFNNSSKDIVIKEVINMSIHMDTSID